MNIEWVLIDDLRPYERNPRRNTKAVDKVADSLKTYGWQQVIVVDQEHTIIAGHTRWLAAKKLKMERVPVLVAKNLTPGTGQSLPHCRPRAFTGVLAKAGGKVIFVGKTPGLVVDKTFLNAKDAPDLSFATLIGPAGDITPRVLAALPKPDVAMDAAFPRLTYTHRSWRDGEMYFFFNESNKAESRMATIAGHGQAQAWDLVTGEIHPLAGGLRKAIRCASL